MHPIFHVPPRSFTNDTYPSYEINCWLGQVEGIFQKLKLSSDPEKLVLDSDKIKLDLGLIS